MQNTLEHLRASIARHCPDAICRSIVPGLLLFRAEAPTTPMDAVYEPRFCVIVQGAKQVMLCDQTFEYDSSKFMVTAVDLPVTSQVVRASQEEPYLALCFTLDPVQIADLLVDMRHDEALSGPLCPSCMRFSDLTHDILDPVTRIVDLLDRPQDIPILFPLYTRELLYRILMGPQGQVLRQIATAGSSLSQLNRAIGWIREHYASSFEIASLARRAGMSPSSFHRHFRAATMMSPLQYRTRLRLQEARRLLLIPGADAAEVGFAVGYDSPSQFSREYRRMFGSPPARDTRELRLQAGAMPEMTMAN
ncbi:AraC family transcriptional regulator [Acetobacter sacchari]|uniref:AraC family transcriptional regulator n=1 Tax=Acetobacter sacchari TaxID=2661687 RepID=A0ABS3LR22_9PROT|nr:AraC family transcriptional regulator [Acetobacter sacchari]MBO1358355.1 AraC family transcriptional regulator [Acetobacter sacchari]